jgi:peptide/nickel transport system permease protein
MKNYLPGKIFRYGIALFGILALHFFLPRLMPGNPALAMIGDGSHLTRDDILALEKLYGLDRTLGAQFAEFLRRTAALDFGKSIHRFTPVKALVFAALGRTLCFSLPALLAGAALGLALGSFAGWNVGGFREKLCTAGALLLHSAPPYLLGILVLYFFTVKTGLFPLPGSGARGLRAMALPFLTMTVFAFSRYFLMMRGSVSLERRKVYPVFALSKGLSSIQALFRHGFKNAALPLITLLAMDLGFLLGGALFVEIVFSVNGIGSLLYGALLGRDYPLIQGILFFLMLTVLALNLLADLVYFAVDPRLREGR